MVRTVKISLIIYNRLSFQYFWNVGKSFPNSGSHGHHPKQTHLQNVEFHSKFNKKLLNEQEITLINTSKIFF